MSADGQAAGCALRCDAEGLIVEIIHDTLGLGSRDSLLGRPLTSVVDRGSLPKALDFWVALQDQGAAFDWELNAAVEGELKTLHFAGVTTDDGALIVAAVTNHGLLQLYEDMMRISNEQMNILRSALKEQSQMARVERRLDASLYDELSRLNNELANLQRELAKKNVQLERLNEQKNQFLGMAAHDLRNPLGVIRGFAEYLLEDAAGVLDEEQIEFLGIIQESSDFMLKLVDDLLDVAQIESGKLHLELLPADLVGVIKRNVALNRALAARKEIEIVFEPEKALPVVEVDAPKIEQVLNNLLSNAVKFSYPGSQIWVRLVREGDEVLLTVEDEGQGIPEDEIGKLFQPFQRTSVQSTAGESSTGLGLAIARRIVNGHGGEIWVESEVGRGSTFYVSLSIHRDGAEEG